MDPQQCVQQKPPEIVGRLRQRDRPVLLVGRRTAPKKILDPNQDLGDDTLKLRVVRRHLRRRVHQHAAFALRVAQ